MPPPDKTANIQPVNTAHDWTILARCAGIVALLCLIFVFVHGGLLVGVAALMACGGYAIIGGVIYAQS